MNIKFDKTKDAHTIFSPISIAFIKGYILIQTRWFHTNYILTFNY